MRRSGWILVSILLLNITVRAADKPIVAVFDVEKGSRVEVEDKALESMVDYIGSRLTESGAYSVVPREQLKKRLFQEQKKSYQECYDRSCQMEVGRALAAEKTLASKVARLGEGCVVSLTLYDLRKTATEKAATRRGGCEEEELVVSLDKALAKLLAAEPVGKEPKTAKAVASPPKLDWVFSQATGLEFTRAEITFAQFQACVAAGVCDAPHLSDNTCAVWTGGQWEKGPLPKRFQGEDQPVSCVDWHQAESFCAWVGGRLPGEGEWVTEASAVGTRKYAWGEEKATCDRAIMDAGVDGCGKHATWPVCSKPAGKSVSGLCDMAGNVWEWTNSPQGKNKVLRGGSWNFGTHQRMLQATSRNYGNPSFRSSDAGIRCVREP